MGQDLVSMMDVPTQIYGKKLHHGNMCAERCVEMLSLTKSDLK